MSKRRKLLWQMNQARREEGLDRLKFEPSLFPPARQHTLQMVRDQRLYHSSPEDLIGSLSDVVWQLAGENVGATSGRVGDLFNAYMDSKAHRQNILRDTFTHAGMGFVRDDEGDLWNTLILYG